MLSQALPGFRRLPLKFAGVRRSAHHEHHLLSPLRATTPGENEQTLTSFTSRTIGTLSLCNMLSQAFIGFRKLPQASAGFAGVRRRVHH
jgi:hypothetical protein